MNNKAVIFDMDGVLIDSWEIHYQSWVVSSKKYGFKVDRQKFGKHFGQTCDSFANTLCEEFDVTLSDSEIQKWFEIKDEYYRDSFKANFQENKCVTRLLKDLRTSGFETSIGSSAPRKNIQTLIDIMPCGELLNNFISAEDVCQGKPNPEVFLKAAEKIRVPANKCAVIEDSVHGLIAAKSAGMVAIGITGTFDGYTLADYSDLVIDSLDELDSNVIIKMLEQLTHICG